MHWTYVPAKVNSTQTKVYSQELARLWSDLTKNLTVTKSRFYFSVFDDNFKNTCPNLVLLLKELEIFDYCTGAGFFAVPAGHQTPIHIDMGFNTVLNFPVFNCDNSFTVWYQNLEEIELPAHLAYVESDSILNDENKELIARELFSDVNKIPYFKYDPTKEIDRVEANQALWVNGAIPHRPEVLHDEFRLLATLRFMPLPQDILEKNLGFIPN